MKGFFKLIFAITIGAIYGLLFAQRSGKSLRADLRKSENPLKLLLEEGIKVDKEACGTVVEWAKNSEDLKKVMDTGKAQFENLVKNAQNLGETAKKELGESLQKMAENAASAADELKKVISKEAKSIEKKVAIAEEIAEEALETFQKKAIKKAEGVRNKLKKF